MDLQGHGRTADIDRPMTCEQHADDIAALLKHLKIEEADFFGDSFGGTIAVMMAVRHPSSFAEWFHTAARLPLSRALPQIDPPRFRLRQMAARGVSEGGARPEAMAHAFRQGPRSLFAWKGFSPDELKAIKAPVLIACGDHDLIPVERCAERSRMIPNAQLAVIPDAAISCSSRSPKNCCRPSPPFSMRPPPKCRWARRKPATTPA